MREDVLRMFRAKVGHWQIDGWEDRQLATLIASENTIAGAIAALLNAEAAMDAKRRSFIKENSIYAYFEFVQSVSIEPSLVMMVRDPRDMAASWKKASVLRGGAVRAARQWAADQTGYLQLLDRLSNAYPCAFCTYESLVSEPGATVDAICRSLDLTFDEGMLLFNERSVTGAQDAARAEVWSNNGSPLIRNNFNKYLDALDSNEVAYIERVCGDLMERFGYRKYSPRFGDFSTFEELEAHLVAREPWEKSSYAALPLEERQRFEQWSRTRDAIVTAGSVDG